jgi:sodium-dependent phosphate cotransporter
MSDPSDQQDSSALHPLVRAAAVLGLLFIFLMGVKGLGDGFKLLGQDVLDSFFVATQNPFVGLLVGILTTSIIQSSSVTTSMIVGLVAAPDNPLPIANAVPMVMGANIGTTVTATVVSLAHMGRRTEFRRAFAVANCHDFFNYFAVLVLLPLELTTGYLRRAAGSIAEFLQGAQGYEYESPLKGALGAALSPIKGLGKALSSSEQMQAVFIIVVCGFLIFFSLFLLVKVMRSAMRTRVEKFMTNVLGSSAILSMAVGTIATCMVQSSSITTSLLVPLAGAGVITLEQAFPVTLGANVGTTITALLAALAVSGPNAIFGIQIALIHLLFNISGTLVIYPIEKIRRIPLRAAQWLADWAVESRKVAIIFVVLMFFVLPGTFVFLYNVFK